VRLVLSGKFRIEGRRVLPATEPATKEDQEERLAGRAKRG